jgi:SHS2 domain-containing protein
MSERRSPYRFEVRDHAADKAATAYGATLNEVFEAAACAMFELMFDLAAVPADEGREMELEASYGEELLMKWLGELLFLFETEHVVFSRFAARVACPRDGADTCRRTEGFGEAPGPHWRLQAVAQGSRYSERMGRRGAVVKAVTYHNLALRPPESPGGDWAAEMVFDV